MRKTASDVLLWFETYKADTVALGKGVFIHDAVRLDLYCDYDAQVTLNGVVKNLQFQSLGDCVYICHLDTNIV